MVFGFVGFLFVVLGSWFRVRLCYRAIRILTDHHPVKSNQHHNTPTLPPPSWDRHLLEVCMCLQDSDPHNRRYGRYNSRHTICSLFRRFHPDIYNPDKQCIPLVCHTFRPDNRCTLLQERFTNTILNYSHSDAPPTCLVDRYILKHSTYNQLPVQEM